MRTISVADSLDRIQVWAVVKGGRYDVLGLEATVDASIASEPARKVTTT